MLIGRLNANGALDTTFGGTGQVLRSVLANVNASGRAIGVQSDGRVVVAGTYAASDGGTGSATYRYTNAGISDSTFAGATVSISGAGYRIPNALVVRADDRIVVGGREWVPNTSGPYPYFSYLRGYAPDGAPDSALNAAFPAQQQDDQISALNVDASGRLLAAGVVNSDSGALAAARRFNPASPLVDQTFKNATVLGVVAGYRGVVLEGSNNTNAVGTGIHELANGDVLMSGFVRANSASVSWFTSRISTLGVVPTGGYASNAMEIKPNNQNGLALASTLAHDGNVVLAGFLTDTSNGKDYPAIAKVAVSGTSTNDAEVVEYYSPTLVKYFMTARLNEKQVLDQPNAAGLARTGVTFNAYATSAGVGKAVRRIFASQAGQFSTHFYLTEAADIAAVKAQPWANDEGVDMYFPTPTGDVSNRVCPTGTHNIWRTFKQKANAAATTTDPNHRYVRTSAALADMIRKGYVDEGVAFCGRL